MVYRMEDGSVINTDKATKSWSEKRDFDGNNMVSRATGSQWSHQTLYRSRKGRYYIEHSSQWQGSRDYVTWESPQAAAAWMLLMGYEVPKDLQAVAADLEE